MRRTLAATAILSGTLMAGSFLGTSVALADDPTTCDAYPGTCPPEVLPTTITKAPDNGTQVEGTKFQRDLPFTGGEIALLSVAGISAIGGGTAMVVASRRRRTTA